MATITQLPAELLHKVFVECFNVRRCPFDLNEPLFKVDDDGLATLVAASQTCRLFHDAILPLLWKNFCLDRHRLKPYPTIPQLIALVRLWHERPEIAAYVHTFHLSPICHGAPITDEDDVAFITSVVRDLGLPAPRWHEAFNGFHFIAALLLPMARNVRVFSMFAFDTGLFKHMPDPGETSVRLEHLTHFQFQSHGSCRGLKGFVFSPYEVFAPPDEILSALSVHAGTLSKLNMALRVNSVAMLTSLEELSVSASYMGRGEDCVLRELPPSLKLLEIRGSPENYPEEMESLLVQIASEGYPNLVEVWLPGWDCDCDHWGPCGGINVDEEHGTERSVEEGNSHDGGGERDWGFRFGGGNQPPCDGGRGIRHLRERFLVAGVFCKPR
ncbi:hypothetical protein CGRA01v4_11638 [Colletotrichum graminicola]|nr:hypothetical protein CGRA01v4_11638 [Colletotrichum graminicola]